MINRDDLKVGAVFIFRGNQTVVTAIGNQHLLYTKMFGKYAYTEYQSPIQGFLEEATKIPTKKERWIVLYQNEYGNESTLYFTSEERFNSWKEFTTPKIFWEKKITYESS